jgi:hypothetical protein
MMKCTLSLVVIVALIAPSLPIAAEEAVVRNVNLMRVAQGPDAVRPGPRSLLAVPLNKTKILCFSRGPGCAS